MTIQYIGRQPGIEPEDALDLYNLHPAGTTFAVPAGAHRDAVEAAAREMAEAWKASPNGESEPAKSEPECHACHRATTGEITWTGEAGCEICQECWEAECSRSWWKMVDALPVLDD